MNTDDFIGFEWSKKDLEALFKINFLTWLYIRPTSATLCACEISCDMRKKEIDHRYITWPIRDMGQLGIIAKGGSGCGADGCRPSMTDGSKQAAYRLINRPEAKAMIQSLRVGLAFGFGPLKPIEFDDISKPHPSDYKQAHTNFVEWCLLTARRDMLLSLLKTSNKGSPITICASRLKLDIPTDVSPHFMSQVVSYLQSLKIIQYQEKTSGKSEISHHGPRGLWSVVDEPAARKWLRDNVAKERPDPYTGEIGCQVLKQNQIVG